jgi:hypothetical protein
MEKRTKKFPLALATAGLTASLGAFAAMPTDAAPFQLVVPNLKSGIDITLEGLYLQPTNSDLDYAAVATTNSAGLNNVNGNNAVITNNTNVQTVDPDYNFGFRVGLGYTFEDSGNDVQLAWTHFNHTDSDSVTPDYGSVLSTRYGVGAPLFYAHNLSQIGGTDVNDVHASSDVKTKLDSVDLDVGQYVDVGTRLRLRMFAGLRFAEVTSDMANTYSANHVHSAVGTKPPETTTTDTVLVENYNSKFTGIGPRVGVDSVYHIGNCFGIVAHAAVALLVGEVESDSNGSFNSVRTTTGGAPDVTVNLTDLDGDGSLTVIGTLDSNDSSRVVPVLDAKLGLNYSHAFENESILTIEGGYQATQYIDAVDRLDGSASGVSASPQAGPVAASVQSSRTTSSVGFNGPYLSLNWKV